jgi:hypothetical protein
MQVEEVDMKVMMHSDAATFHASSADREKEIK